MPTIASCQAAQLTPIAGIKNSISLRSTYVEDCLPGSLSLKGTFLILLSPRFLIPPCFSQPIFVCRNSNKLGCLGLRYSRRCTAFGPKRLCPLSNCKQRELESRVCLSQRKHCQSPSGILGWQHGMCAACIESGLRCQRGQTQ